MDLRLRRHALTGSRDPGKRCFPDDVTKKVSFEEVGFVKCSRVLPMAAILAVVVATGLSPLRAQTTHPAAAKGSYSPAQAAAGAKLYEANCSACHGANMHGPLGPALIGDAFTSQFTNEPVSDMYGLMSKNMPLGDPGSLKPAEYLEITAYILQRNKYPTGPAPLTQAKLKTIKIVAPSS
jgi:mono/diheme cytochrome c family protein